MNKVAWVAWAVKNIVALICLTVLAIYFNRWWIAILALLFMDSIKTEHTTTKNENGGD